MPHLRLHVQNWCHALWPCCAEKSCTWMQFERESPPLFGEAREHFCCQLLQAGVSLSPSLYSPSRTTCVSSSVCLGTEAFHMRSCPHVPEWLCLSRQYAAWDILPMKKKDRKMRLMRWEVAILWWALADALCFNLSKMCTDLSAFQTNSRL